MLLRRPETDEEMYRAEVGNARVMRRVFKGLGVVGLGIVLWAGGDAIVDGVQGQEVDPNTTIYLGLGVVSLAVGASGARFTDQQEANMQEQLDQVTAQG